MTPEREALETLVAACEQIYCSPATEGPDGYDDDSAVAANIEGDDYRLTFGMIRRARKTLSAAPGEPCAWVKRLADNWRGRRDSLTGDSVRDSCADELEKVAACHATPQPAAGWDEAIEVCIRELQYCRDHGHEPDITTIKKLTALRREAPAPAEGVVHTPAQFVDDVLSACDASNWDAELNTGDYFRGLRDAYERIHELAGEYQTSMYAWSRPSARPDTAETLPRWRHKKRGTIYTEIGRGFAQVSHHPIEEMTAVVIYRATDGRLWVRNAVEFDDGRFEALSPPSGGDEAKESEGVKSVPCPVCGGEAIHAIETLKRTIIKPGPSEPSPPADRREIVVRVLARWKRSKNLHESLAAESIEKELLAALDGGR